MLKDKYALHQTLAKLEKAGEHVREVAGRARGASLSVAWDGFDSYKSSNFRYKGKAMGDMKGIGGGAGSESAGYAFKTQGVLLLECSMVGDTTCTFWIHEYRQTPTSILNAATEH